jgi:hypothetical protein
LSADVVGGLHDCGTESAQHSDRLHEVLRMTQKAYGVVVVPQG